MIDELQTLAEHSDKAWAKRRAEQAVQVYEQYQSGGLDEWEYKDIMLRIVDDKELDREADDLDTKQLLVTAVYSVADIF